MQCQIADGSVKPSIDVLKKANNQILLSSSEHYKIFDRLHPFLESFKVNNSGFKYSLIKDANNQFQRCAILFPYSNEAIKSCYKVVAVDAAFMDFVNIKGIYL